MTAESTQGDVKVLMVCLGNICRSPMAEAVFLDELSRRSPEVRARVTKVDSCGTGAYHVGDDPDDRTVATCKKHNVPINSVARALEKNDFHEFTHILAMDRMNVENIKRARPSNSKAVVSLFSSHEPVSVAMEVDIVDPYYGTGSSGFERCYKQCLQYSKSFLDQVESGTLQMPANARSSGNQKAGL